VTTSQTPRPGTQHYGQQQPSVPAQYSPYATYQQPGQVPPPAAPRPTVRARRWPWIVGIVAAFVVGLAVGGAGGSGGSTTAPVAAPASPAAPVPTQSAPAASTAPAAPAAPAVPTGPATEVEDGTYQVGTDMAAGRYKTPGPPANSVMDMCYSARMKDDSGDINSIIANDIVKGQSSITVKAGEFVKFSGGCTWTKQ
jgi:hypothetical protein